MVNILTERGSGLHQGDCPLVRYRRIRLQRFGTRSIIYTTRMLNSCDLSFPFTIFSLDVHYERTVGGWNRAPSRRRRYRRPESSAWRPDGADRHRDGGEGPECGGGHGASSRRRVRGGRGGGRRRSSSRTNLAVLDLLSAAIFLLGWGVWLGIIHPHTK
jgi:hypothetical protein